MKTLKSKKILVALAILLFVVGLGVAIGVIGNYDSGTSYTYYNSDVDSNVTYYSPWFDATSFDGQTTYMNIYYYASGSIADTLALLTIEGNTKTYNSTTANLLVDTVDIVGRDVTDAGVAAVITNTTGATPAGALTGQISANGRVHHIILSPQTATRYPQWRLKFTGSSNNGVFLANVYSPINDYTPEKIGAYGTP